MPAYDSLVIGSGAAGIATVGALLHYQPQFRIAWVDPDFQGGRISKYYRDVSSNTKVKLFVDYAEALDPFLRVGRETPEPNAITVMKGLEQGQGCRLGYAADVLEMLTKGLRRMEGVEGHVGKVQGLRREGGRWVWEMKGRDGPEEGEAQRVVMCTGSSPSAVKLPTEKVKLVDLDDTLDRAKLRDLLPKDEDVTVGIVGTSHSGVVVIMNLYELARTTHPRLKVKWFVRSELMYAVEMDGWILRDNTGLKGASADFAREHLEKGKLEHSPVGKYLTQVHTPDASSPDMKSELETCTHIVQAIGYTRDKLPQLEVDEREVKDVAWDPETGLLLDNRRQPLPQAFGAGIAFPRRVTDPHGNTEYAVGMWKFMKYLKEVVPKWLQTVP